MKVLFSPQADSDLDDIYDLIAEDNPERAIAYVRAIRKYVEPLQEFPHMAPAYSELGPEVRLLPFQKRANILYRVYETHVEILRIHYAGQTA